MFRGFFFLQGLLTKEDSSPALCSQDAFFGLDSMRLRGRKYPFCKDSGAKGHAGPESLKNGYLDPLGDMLKDGLQDFHFEPRSSSP